MRCSLGGAREKISALHLNSSQDAVHPAVVRSPFFRSTVIVRLTVRRNSPLTIFSKSYRAISSPAPMAQEGETSLSRPVAQS